MKYDDEELAEAALLLAHQEDAGPLSPELERKLLAQAGSIAAEVRFSTTKGAAVTLEQEPLPAVPERRSTLRAWSGWFAAAACFAFAVYEWRSHAIERDVTRSSAVAPADPAPTELVSTTGGRVGAVVWDRSARAITIRIDTLAPSGSGEHYRVWTAAGGADPPVLLGSFVRAVHDDGATFSAPVPASPTMPLVWLTRNDLTDGVVFPGMDRVVAHSVNGTP